MINKKKVTVFGFVFILLLSLFTVTMPRSVSAAGEVSVTDSNIVWSPYNWVFSGSTYAQTPTTGSYLKVAFTGSTLGLNLDTSTFDDVTPNVTASAIILTAYIDGSSTGTQKTLAEVSSGQLIFRNDLSAGDHYAQIFVSRNTNYGSRWGTFPDPGNPVAALVRITSVQLASDGQIKSLANTPLAKSPLKIIYYGDSITEGNGISSTHGEQSHAARVAQGLGVEYAQKGYASLAWGVSFFAQLPNFHHLSSETSSYSNSVWRNVYKNQSLFVGNQPSGGFTEGEPDAIFNNLGINDYGSRGAGWNTTTDMKARIKSWLADTRTAAGPRPAIIMVVPFNFGNSGGADVPEWKAAYLAGINEYKSENPTDQRVYTIDLGVTAYNIAVAQGDGLHFNPTGAQQIADLIIPEVGAIGTKIIPNTALTAASNGSIITEGMTVDSKPTFSGTAPAGSTVTVTINSDPVTCTAVADTSGYWTCTFTTAVPAGAHSLAISANTVWGTTLQLASVGIYVNGTLASTGLNSNLVLFSSVSLIGAGGALALRHFANRRSFSITR